MLAAGVDPHVVGTVLTVLTSAGVLKFAEYLIRVWKEDQRDRRDAQKLAAGETLERDPGERLLRLLQEELDRERARCERERLEFRADIERLEARHAADRAEDGERLDNAEEASRHLQHQHEECEKKLQGQQIQLGDQARQIANLERAAGLKP